MACPDVSRCDYACLRRGVCDHQGVWKAGMDWAATLAICAFDDRCRMRSQNLDWDEGFHAGTQAAAKAIRAVLTASPAGDDPKALDAAARFVRHKKRGTTYRVIGVGKMQAENWHKQADELARYPVDMAEVVTYQCLEDGALWVRPVAEFNDGRFEDVPAPERFAAARSSSTEAVEQEVEKLREALEAEREACAVIADLAATNARTNADRQEARTLGGTAVYTGYTFASTEARAIAAAIRARAALSTPVPAACKPEGETHG